MKKQGIAPFILLSAVFMCFCAGLFLGRNLNPNLPEPVLSQELPVTIEQVDLNRADLQELMTLPGIGQTLATRILDYRQSHGSIASIGELLRIDGIGESRLEALLPYITTGG